MATTMARRNRDYRGGFSPRPKPAAPFSTPTSLPPRGGPLTTGPAPSPLTSLPPRGDLGRPSPFAPAGTGGGMMPPPGGPMLGGGLGAPVGTGGGMMPPPGGPSPLTSFPMPPMGGGLGAPVGTGGGMMPPPDPLTQQQSFGGGANPTSLPLPPGGPMLGGGLGAPAGTGGGMMPPPPGGPMTGGIGGMAAEQLGGDPRMQQLYQQFLADRASSQQQIQTGGMNAPAGTGGPMMPPRPLGPENIKYAPPGLSAPAGTGGGMMPPPGGPMAQPQQPQQAGTPPMGGGGVM